MSVDTVKRIFAKLEKAGYGGLRTMSFVWSPEKIICACCVITYNLVLARRILKITSRVRWKAC